MRSNGSGTAGKVVCLFCREDELYREEVRVGPNPNERRTDIKRAACGKVSARITRGR